MLKKAYDAMERKMIEISNKLTKSERGDTNFISILIILGIVIVVATVFLGFKEQIVGMVQDIVGDFTIAGPAE